MTLATTDAGTIRVKLARFIERIKPSAPERSAERWVWRDGQEIGGKLRNFDILQALSGSVPNGVYGDGGIEYACATTIRVAYPGDDELSRRLASRDIQDLSALLAQLHELEGGIDGMRPVNMSATAALPQLVPLIKSAREGEQIFDLTFELRYFAPDTVELFPAPA